MLLFLLNFMLNSFASENCSLKDEEVSKMAKTIYVCDQYFMKFAVGAAEYWNERGFSLTVDKKVDNCSYLTEYHTMHIRFNEQFLLDESVGVPKKLGISQKYLIYNTLIYTTINITTDELSDYNMQKLIIHEVGHGLGYMHVDGDCTDHIMNPHLYKSGMKFY